MSNTKTNPPTPLGQCRPQALAAIAITLWVSAGWAQPNAEVTMAAPTAAQMIEQLKARPIEPPTRGFGTTRQLIIEEVEVVRPSLSLDIRFDFDSAKVRPESRQALQNLAKALVSPELLSARFAVEGHTDAKGRADYNQKLSQLRAEAVRDFLAHQAVEPQRLVASGKGASEPANAEDPNAAENRRVRIVNLN